MFIRDMSFFTSWRANWRSGMPTRRMFLPRATEFTSTPARPTAIAVQARSAAHAIIVTMHQLQSPQPAMNLRPLGAAMAARGTAVNVPPGRPASNAYPRRPD